MVVRSRRLAETAKSGQFLHIRAGQGFMPFLRRPLSVGPCRGDRLTLIFTVRGEGTRLLSLLQPGAALDIIGPLGTSFVMPPENSEVLLVAGGIGVVPLLLLDDQLPKSQARRFLLGIRSLSYITVGNADLTRRKIKLATDDGSTGFKGNVINLLERELAEIKNPLAVYGCGPAPMLTTLKELCLRRGIPAQVSLEVPMGCGVGACQSCAVPRADGAGYYMVCRDGPTFDINAVDLTPGMVP